MQSAAKKSAVMNGVHRKSKMISVRVSPDAYIKLCEACELRGFVSVSELARVALEELIGFEPKPGPVTVQLSSMDNGLRMLRSAVDRLTDLVAKGIASG
jgi:hypothetical protein